MSIWSRSDSPPPPSYHSTQRWWEVQQNNSPRPPTSSWSSSGSTYSRPPQSETTRLFPKPDSNRHTGNDDQVAGGFLLVCIVMILTCVATVHVYPTVYPPSQAALDEARRQWRLEKAKMRLYWDDLRGDDQCLGHDRVHYRALLRNVQSSVINAVDACKDTSITINGIHYASPAWCEDVGNSNVYGHWIVGNEGKCASYWQYFKDKGCTARGSRTRRFEAPLSGPHWGQNQERLCLTTPATIMGQTFSSPMACPLWGSHGFWGVWDVRDDYC